MRFVPVLVLALFAAAPITAHARANPSCLAAPTQGCVFQLAVDQALNRPEVTDVLRGLVETALLQEAAGRDDWVDTLDRLPPVVKDHHPKVRKDFQGKALQASWIAGRQAGADALLALLPPEDLPEALAALGLAQIATADLPAAQATKARISAISRQHPALRTLRKKLAPLLAAQGQGEKAVAMAHTLGLPSVTAHVAAALGPVATD
jgi:hypothetical protein